MIQNIVFDMGRVLLQFDPLFISSHFTETAQDAQLLAENVFQSVFWDLLDRGTITHQQFREMARMSLPQRLWPNLDRALEQWYHHIPAVEGMEPILRSLKAKGLGLYLLTNANIQFHQYHQQLPARECFDGILVSADHEMMKPEPAIYRQLAQLYALELSQCLFVDDRPVNIIGAKFCWMQGLVFQDAQTLKEELQQLGIL